MKLGKQRRRELLKCSGKQSGFTFIELLLVLSVVSILTFIILPLGDRWIRVKSDEDALQTLIACVYNMQAHSMAHQISTKLIFRNNGTEYVVHRAGGVELCSGVFPPGMHLSTRSNMRVVEFTPDGNVFPSGIMTINTNTGSTEIRFQLVRGRIIVYD